MLMLVYIYGIYIYLYLIVPTSVLYILASVRLVIHNAKLSGLLESLNDVCSLSPIAKKMLGDVIRTIYNLKAIMPMILKITCYTY